MAVCRGKEFSHWSGLDYMFTSGRRQGQSYLSQVDWKQEKWVSKRIMLQNGGVGGSERILDRKKPRSSHITCPFLFLGQRFINFGIHRNPPQNLLKIPISGSYPTSKILIPYSEVLSGSQSFLQAWNTGGPSTIFWEVRAIRKTHFYPFSIFAAGQNKHFFPPNQMPEHYPAIF